MVMGASMAGLASGGLGTYSTSKHAVVAITEKLVMELQTNGAFPTMGASVLCPAFVATNIFDSERYKGEGPVTIDEAKAGMTVKMLSQGGARILSPEEVSDMVFASIASRELYILPHAMEAKLAVNSRAETILRKVVPPLPSSLRVVEEQQEEATKARL